MSAKATNTPPECCPICGTRTLVARDEMTTIERADIRSFFCGAQFFHANDEWMWTRACEFSMAAAIRCGATLRPTPREAENEQLRDLLAVAKTIITKHHKGSEAEIEYWGRLCPICTSYLSILDAIYTATQEIK